MPATVGTKIYRRYGDCKTVFTKEKGRRNPSFFNSAFQIEEADLRWKRRLRPKLYINTARVQQTAVEKVVK